MNELQITTSAAEMPQVLYIMGTGRSGTTILEVLLTNNPGVTGCGEVTQIFRDGFLNDAQCACGNAFHRCEFWSRVRLESALDKTNPEEFARLFHRYSWHARFPQLALNLDSQNDRRTFSQLNAVLFSAVARIGAANIVVDSSKYAGRALALARCFPGKVRIVCITREPAGLLNAFEKTDVEHKPKSGLSTLLYFIYAITCFRIVSWLQQENVFAIKYEDLKNDPETVLMQIEAWSGIDLSNSRKLLAHHQMLDVGHIVTGNRLRHRKHVRFNRGAVLEYETSWVKQFITKAMHVYRAILRF